MLGKLFEDQMQQKGLSLREAARQIGVSHTTLVAVKAGSPLEVNTAYLVCRWLGVPLTAAVDDVTEADQAYIRIAATLKNAPELEQIFIMAAEETEQGTLTAEDFREILQFAAFKIQQRKDRARIEKSGLSDDHKESV